MINAQGTFFETYNIRVLFSPSHFNMTLIVDPLAMFRHHRSFLFSTFMKKKASDKETIDEHEKVLKNEFIVLCFADDELSSEMKVEDLAEISALSIVRI